MQAGLDNNLLDAVRDTLDAPTRYDDSPIGPARTTPSQAARQVNRASWGRTPDAVRGQAMTAQLVDAAGTS